MATHRYSCLENPMDRGAQRATVHGVTESGTTEATQHAAHRQGFTCCFKSSEDCFVVFRFFFFLDGSDCMGTASQIHLYINLLDQEEK